MNGRSRFDVGLDPHDLYGVAGRDRWKSRTRGKTAQQRRAAKRRARRKHMTLKRFIRELA